MKRVVRLRVFETNSSSTHTLTLVPTSEYEADKKTAKPQYGRYGVVASKEDKLLMVCGCCWELFVTEGRLAIYAQSGDDFDIRRKQRYDEIKDAIAQGLGDTIDMYGDNVYYEVAMDLIVRTYCEMTGADYAETYTNVDKINRSGRACHMKFFEEGALDDPEWDYMVIEDMFNGSEKEALNALRYYFDDDMVLLYREYYAGVRWNDDED